VGTFGDKFRAERERRNFTLDDVSNVTKISARMLKAIEDEHFDQLPGGVFNKGFIRAYAKHLQLNDEEAVTEYLACLRQAQIDAQTAAWEPERQRPLTPPAATTPPVLKPAATSSTPKTQPAKSAPQVAKQPAPAARPVAHVPAQGEELPDLQLPRADHIHTSRKFPGTRNVPAIPWRIPAIALLVVVVGAALWNRHTRGARADVTNPAPQTAQNAPPPAPVLANNSPAPPATAPGVVPNVTAPATPGAASSSHTPRPGGDFPTPSGDLQLPNSASSSSTPAPLTQASSSANAPIKKSVPSATDDVSSQPAPSNIHPPSPKKSPTPPTPTFTLVIRAVENSWISVAADGQTVTRETLIAPAHTSVRATREIVVRAGNAAAVSFLFNGKEIPATGAEGEVKTFVFDSAGLTLAPSSDTAH
jgi:cytoskeletal protein RodZ